MNTIKDKKQDYDYLVKLGKAAVLKATQTNPIDKNIINKSIEIFMKAIDISLSKDTQAYKCLAYILWKFDQTERAIDILEDALHINPDDISVSKMIREIQEGKNKALDIANEFKFKLEKKGD